MLIVDVVVWIYTSRGFAALVFPLIFVLYIQLLHVNYAVIATFFTFYYILYLTFGTNFWWYRLTLFAKLGISSRLGGIEGG